MLARGRRKILGFLHRFCVILNGFQYKISKCSLNKGAGGFFARSNLKKKRNKGGSLLGIILIAMIWLAGSGMCPQEWPGWIRHFKRHPCVLQFPFLQLGLQYRGSPLATLILPKDKRDDCRETQCKGFVYIITMAAGGIRYQSPACFTHNIFIFTMPMSRVSLHRSPNTRDWNCRVWTFKSRFLSILHCIWMILNIFRPFWMIFRSI